jgi:formylglycine-generating enzyme required for sulfatase activity
VGSLKPNDLGLFDMQGNLFTWCREIFKAYPVGKGNEAAEDQDGLVVRSTDYRVLRGCSFIDQASIVRSAYRGNYVPTIENVNIGIRPARTLPLGSFTALPHTAEGRVGR